MRVLVTGSQGFIGTYLCKELLDSGYAVIGIDNYCKYGPVSRPHDTHPGFTLIAQDIADRTTRWPVSEVDYVISLAASIGGISYFSRYPYSLYDTNENINSNVFFQAKKYFERGCLERLVVVSSSMVYERAESWPTKESDLTTMGPPLSSYGFQKLSCEVRAKALWDEFKVPYTIVRPFNAVGAYEDEALASSETYSGNIKLQLSHVLPDLINKCLKGQDPLHILGNGLQIRCYTNGRDIARGIRLAMESPKGKNEDFNISTSTHTTVLELARLVWDRINPTKPFRWVLDNGFEHDVQRRIPDVNKAKELLGFEAKVSLEDSIDEVIDYLRKTK